MGEARNIRDEQEAVVGSIMGGIIDRRQLKEIADLMASIDDDDPALNDVGAYDIIEAEEQVAHYVRSGEIELLLRMPLPEPSVPPAGVSPLVHFRFLLVSLNALCLHAALDGGVSKRIAYGLNRRLSLRILGCTTEDELHELSRSRLITLSYALLVRELSLPSVTDTDILRVIRYIHDHHHEHIVVRELAENVGLSPEYLSAKFKRVTGMPVSRYISKMRIEEAKALLRFSSLSIGEIAAQLAFSSQSYFQTAFKREVGTTPQQYRLSVGWKEDQTP